MTNEEASLVLDNARPETTEYDRGFYDDEDLNTAINMAMEALNDRHKGEWIEVVEEKFPNGEKRMWHYECSACSAGEPFCPINKEHWDFCPNCGADMRGGKE